MIRVAAAEALDNDPHVTLPTQRHMPDGPSVAAEQGRPKRLETVDRPIVAPRRWIIAGPTLPNAHQANARPLG